MYPSLPYKQTSQQAGTLGRIESGGGVHKTLHLGTVNVRSFLSRHLENKVFEAVTFGFEGRSCFSVFVIVIVVLLLLSRKTNFSAFLQA